MASNTRNAITHLFLIGMPAVGKTFWGTEIARYYGLPFVDLDTIIVEGERHDIPSLFAQYGEEGFREREHQYLVQVIATAVQPTVISCGGGTPCFYDHINLMKSVGFIVYLQSDVPYLLKNIAGRDSGRPLLQNAQGDLAAHLEGTLQRRKYFYEQAQYILPVQDISVSTFEKIIDSCISRH